MDFCSWLHGFLSLFDKSGEGKAYCRHKWGNKGNMDGLQWARRSLKEEGLSPKLQLSCHNHFTFTFSALRCVLKAFTICDCEWDVTASFKSNLPKQNVNLRHLNFIYFVYSLGVLFRLGMTVTLLNKIGIRSRDRLIVSFQLKKVLWIPSIVVFNELLLTNSKTVDLSFFYENFLPTKVHVTSLEFGFREEYFQDSVSSQIFLGI